MSLTNNALSCVWAKRIVSSTNFLLSKLQNQSQNQLTAKLHINNLNLSRKACHTNLLVDDICKGLVT